MADFRYQLITRNGNPARSCFCDKGVARQLFRGAHCVGEPRRERGYCSVMLVDVDGVALELRIGYFSN